MPLFFTPKKKIPLAVWLHCQTLVTTYILFQHCPYFQLVFVSSRIKTTINIYDRPTNILYHTILYMLLFFWGVLYMLLSLSFESTVHQMQFEVFNNFICITQLDTPPYIILFLFTNKSHIDADHDVTLAWIQSLF